MKHYIVLGYTQAGKTTAGEMIAKMLGGVCRNISDGLKRVYSECIDEKIYPQSRERLFLFGRGIESGEPGSLAGKLDLCTDDLAALCGIRTSDDLHETLLDGNFKCNWGAVLWINRDGVTQGPTDAMPLSEAKRVAKIHRVPFHIIENNGTFADLAAKLADIIGKDST